MKTTWNRPIAILATAACLLPPFGAGAAAEAQRLVLAHGAGAASKAHTLFLKPWAQRLSIVSEGRLEIAVEADAEQPDSDLFRRLAAGEIDLVWAPADAAPADLSDMEIFELPFLAWPAEATSQAALTLHRKRNEAPGGEIAVVFLHAGAPAWLHMTRSPVRRPEDLFGRRIYAPTRSLRALLDQAGAEAVTLDEPTRAAAMLAQGELDGAALSFAEAAALGVVAATRYHTRVGRPPDSTRTRRPGLATRLHVLVMNAARYAALPEDIGALILGSADLALAEHTGRAWDSLDRLARRAARAEGHVFYELTEADRRAWHRLARPVIDAWVAEAGARGRDGAKLLAEARSLIARFYVLMSEEIEARTRPAREQGG